MLGQHFLLIFLVLSQTANLVAQLAQMVQIHLLRPPPPQANGIVGALNVEWVQFVWNTSVLLFVAVLITLYRPNLWLWLVAVFAVWHEVEHAYLISVYLRTAGVTGNPGLAAQGGLLGGGLPISRPDLHFLYDLAETVPLWLVLRTASLRPNMGRAAVSLWRAAGSVLVAAIVVAAGTVTDAASGRVRCADVASAVGLDFRNTYGPTPASGTPDQMAMMVQQNMGNGAAIGDYVGDGFLSVYLLGQAGHPSRLYRNVEDGAGHRRFVDVTDQAGLADQRGLSRVAFFADLNGDGLLDLIVINDFWPGTGLESSKIYRNNGDGTFSDVTSGSGFAPMGFIVGGAALADFDRSGLPGIYISYWTEQFDEQTAAGTPAPGKYPGENRLFKNLGDFHFQDVTREVGLAGLAQDSFTPVFADLFRTGELDLFVLLDNQEGDRLYRMRSGHFVDVTDDATAGHKGNDMGVGVRLHDGIVDLYLTSIADRDGNFGGRAGGNTFLSGQRDDSGSVRFTPRSRVETRNTGWGWGATFIDMQLDGLADLAVVQGFQQVVGDQSPSLRDERAHLFVARTIDKFADDPYSGCEPKGDQRTVIAFDYNRDGAPDLLITQVNGPPLLLENRTSPTGHWLTVIPHGPGALPINARVTVSAGGRVSEQLLIAGGSYLAGPPQEGYFGLGSATRVDEVRVQFSDGVFVTLHDVAADQVLRIAHPTQAASR
jgi:phage tail protein X